MYFSGTPHFFPWLNYKITRVTYLFILVCAQPNTIATSHNELLLVYPESIERCHSNVASPNFTKSKSTHILRCRLRECNLFLYFLAQNVWCGENTTSCVLSNLSKSPFFVNLAVKLGGPAKQPPILIQPLLSEST